MTLTKAPQPIDGTFLLKKSITCFVLFIDRYCCRTRLLFSELHDPLRQLVIMTESNKNIDKNQVEIVANIAAKVAVSCY